MAPEWSVLRFDELLTQTHMLGIALPRLPSRRMLEESGYLTPPRPTALKDVLEDHGSPLQYLKHLALVQQHPAAVEAWNKRHQADDDRDEHRPAEQGANDMTIRKRPASEEGGEESIKGKKLKKKDRSYGTLFKKPGASARANVASQGWAA
jgi:hypothetical protein